MTLHFLETGSGDQNLHRLSQERLKGPGRQKFLTYTVVKGGVSSQPLLLA